MPYVSRRTARNFHRVERLFAPVQYFFLAMFGLLIAYLFFGSAIVAIAGIA